MTQSNNLSPIDVARLHQKSDVDAPPTSQHHTLGPQASQASPGDHIHDGKQSKKVFTPVAVTGSRGGNVALDRLLIALHNQGIITNNTSA